MVRKAFQRWLLRRLPATDNWLLTQRTIYIVPTRAGFAFAATLLLMLVAAINYQLNLGYALTFLLGGAGLVSMHLTHATLRGLTLHLRPPSPVHAGEMATLDLVLDNRGRSRHGLAVHFQDRHEAGGNPSFAWCDVPAGGQETARLAIAPARRGWHDLPLIVVETVFPFGLFRAWTVWRPTTRVLAWPRPEHPTLPLPSGAATAGELTSRRHEGGSEFDGVRAYRRGDSMRAVVWKKVARSGQLVSRENGAAASRELWLDWSATPAADSEQRASRLAAWVLAAERDGIPYGLRLPGHEVAPGQGAVQRRTVLDLLATQ